jgi:hypothetical protein
MRTDFTTAFETARSKTAHEPVCLMKIDWPSTQGFPSKTLCLADRGTEPGTAYLTAAGQSWLALVEDWGGLQQKVADDGGEIEISLLNSPADLGSGYSERFSDLFDRYPPETASVVLYQWFEGEGLGAGDLAELFTLGIARLLDYDEYSCRLVLAPFSHTLGSAVLGRSVDVEDYPRADASAYGKTIPLVFGKVECCPAIPVRVAQKTELTRVILPGDTALMVKSTEDFPNAGSVVIDGDTVLYTGKTATSFTGCMALGESSLGIRSIHYNGDAVVQKISDHRYLLSDPDYGLKSVANVKVAGRPADASEYYVDLNRGEVVFRDHPKKIAAVDSQFLEVQFNAVDAANTALTPEFAFDAAAVTSHAVVRQTKPVLRLRRTGVPAGRGDIKRVFLAVEHFEQEKIPNDRVRVAIDSIGTLGYFSKPNADDSLLVDGNVDITHNHLENLGGRVDIEHGHGNNLAVTTPIDHSHAENLQFGFTASAHNHSATTDGLKSITQQALQNTSYGYFNQSIHYSLPVSIQFPAVDPSLGTIVRTDYYVEVAPTPTFSLTSTEGRVYVLNALTGIVMSVTLGGTSVEFHKVSPVEGSSSAPTTVTLSAAGFAGVSLLIRGVSRVVHIQAATVNSAVSVGGSNTKTGGVNPVTGFTAPGSVGGGVVGLGPMWPELSKTGAISPHTQTPVLHLPTQEKPSRAVIERFDITSHVTGWNWFAGQTVEIRYEGATDGRASYVVHVFFDVEFATPKYEYTNDVVADVEGIKDASGAITGTPGALIERPDHIFLWSLKEVLRLPDSAIEASSFAEAGNWFAGAVPGGYRLGSRISKPEEVRKLWSAWGRESRSFLHWNWSGKATLKIRPLNDATGRSSVKALTASMIRWDPQKKRTLLRKRRTPLAELANRVTVYYNFHPDEKICQSRAVRENAASRVMFGLWEMQKDGEFLWVRSKEMAENLAEFYLAESAWPAVLIEAEVFLDSMELETGDILTISKSLDSEQPVLALVMGVRRNLGSGSAATMDSAVLSLRLFPITVTRSVLGESIAVGEAVTQWMQTCLMAKVEPAEFFFSRWPLVFMEAVQAQENIFGLLKPMFLESVSPAEIARTLWRGGLIGGATVNEACWVPGRSGGYGAQPYAVSGYGGMEFVDNSVFRLWQFENTALTETAAWTFKYPFAASIGEFAFLATNAGYGVAPNGLSGYGGREILS